MNLTTITSQSITSQSAMSQPTWSQPQQFIVVKCSTKVKTHM